MKVILRQEVDNLGLAGDVVDVADGYGRNFLLPRGMAMLATKGAMKEAEALLRSRKAAEAATLGEAEEMKQILESRTLRVEERVDDRGHLYGSVRAADIARVLKERGHDIPTKHVFLSGSIKEIGTYEVEVRVHPQLNATVEVEVLDVEGLVIAGQIEEYVPPPLPGEEVAAEAVAEAVATEDGGELDEATRAAIKDATEIAPTSEGDSLAQAAIEAALEYEAAAAERLETEAGDDADEGDDEAATDEAADTEEPTEG